VTTPDGGRRPVAAGETAIADEPATGEHRSADTPVHSGRGGPGATDPADPCAVSGLTVRYGSRLALQDVTLTVPSGAVTAVVGGDGAGKTTLLRTVVGLVRPTAGEVRRPDRRDLGFISGTTGVYRDLTVAENLDFAARAYGAATGSSGRRDELLERIGLAGFQDRLAGDLSGGMRQKLAVALALLHRPRVLILDEATTGVDPVSRAEVWRTVSGAAADGAAVLMATTYLDEAERAGWICLLDRGRMLLSAPPAEIVATVRDGMYVAPAGDTVPAQAAWRSGTTWRIWSPCGPPPCPGGRATSAEADLTDAVIVATLRAEPETADEVAVPITDPPPSATSIKDDDPPAASGPEKAPGSAPPDAGSAIGGAARTGVAETAHDVDSLVIGRGLVRRFGSFTAVDHVDIEVRPGEVVGLLGANGAGKTTLIRLLLGLLLPTAGEISLLGLPPSRATRMQTGYVPQGLGLWDDLTVTENLLFATAAFGVSAPAGLDPDLSAAGDTLVRDLPLGLRRRLAFAAALAHAPRLLILDEPTSGVDPLARARLWETVRRAAATGVGVLVTTHYMAEANQCDRLVLMAGGRIALSGTVSDLVGTRTAAEIDCADWSAAFAALDGAGLPVSLNGRRLRVPVAAATIAAQTLADHGLPARLHPVPASLEEVFVEIAAGHHPPPDGPVAETAP